MMKNLSKFKKIRLSDVVAKYKVNNPKIILIGNFGNGNIGDEILLYSVSKDLENIGGLITAVVRSKKMLVEENRTLDTELPYTIKLFFKFMVSDFLIVGPGGLYGKDVGPFTRLIPLVIFISKLLRKKVIYYGFGIYADTPKYIQQVVAISCYLSNDVFVRDEHSLRLLQRKNYLKSKVKLILDPAFLIENYVNKRQKKNEISIKQFGISLRYIENDDERNIFIAKIVNAINRIDSKHILVPLNFYKEPSSLSVKRIHPSDELMFKAIKDKVTNNKTRFKDVEKLKSIKVLIDQYYQLDGVVAMRFHAQVLSIIFDLPLLAIGYSPKNEFSKNYSKGVFMTVSAFDSEKIEMFLQKNV